MRALATESKEWNETPHYERDLRKGLSGRRIGEYDMLLKYSRRKKTYGSLEPSQGTEQKLSKNCPKLLPSLGFEPRPFAISEQHF